MLRKMVIEAYIWQAERIRNDNKYTPESKQRLLSDLLDMLKGTNDSILSIETDKKCQK